MKDIAADPTHVWSLLCFLKDYSAVLVIPDCYERTYVRDLIDILLLKMGFKQICVQQASLVPFHLPAPETFHFLLSD